MLTTNLYYQIINNFPELKYALLDAQTFDPTHFGFPEIYYKVLETDASRIHAFERAFQHYDMLKDKIVCEAGVGRLALTRHYLPYVKKAYLIENNPNIISTIQKELKDKGWNHKVEFIIGNAMKVNLPEQVDFIIGELMSIYSANEYQVQIFKHLRKFLKPEGKLIPEKIINMAQLGHAQFDEGHTHYPLLFTRHWPELLTTQEILNTIDLYHVSRYTVRKTIKLKAHLSGQTNCLLMNSLVQLVEGINFTGTDSLMPPTVKLLKAPSMLTAGDRIKMKAQFTYGTSLDEAIFEIV